MTGTCKLYRHFDGDDVLLYVGVSKSALRRLSEHSTAKWADDIVRVSVQNFPSRSEALKAEREAILKERPKYNIAGTKPPVEFTGIPRKTGTATMTPAERQSLKRARERAGLVRMEIWVPQEKYAALAEFLAEYT